MMACTCTYCLKDVGTSLVRPGTCRYISEAIMEAIYRGLGLFSLFGTCRYLIALNNSVLYIKLIKLETIKRQFMHIV